MTRSGKDQLKMQVVKLECWNNSQFILQQFKKLLINLPVITKICILQKSSKSHTSLKKKIFLKYHINLGLEFLGALLTKLNQTQHSPTKPKQTQPKPTKPNQIQPRPNKSSQTKLSPAKPSQIPPNRTKPNQTKSNSAKPRQAQPNTTKPSQTQLNSTITSHTQSNPAKLSKITRTITN